MKQGFIFTITDSGCFVAFIKKNEVIADAFFATPDQIKGSKVFEHLTAYYKDPIVIILDTLNQTFFEEAIPPTNLYYKKRIINIIKDEHKNDSNSILHYKKTKDLYQFSMAQLSNDNNLWLSYINQLENPIDSVRSMPIESQVLLKKLPQTKPLNIITYYDPHIGLRQTAFLYNQFFLSRLISLKKKSVNSDIASETRKLITYIQKEEAGITDKDINIISLGESGYYKSIDPRMHMHLDATNIQQVNNLKKVTTQSHFISCLTQLISMQKPKAEFQFDILKLKEKQERLHILINGLSLGVFGFLILYLFASVSSFKTFMAGIPSLKADIISLEKNIESTPQNHSHTYSENYRKTITKIQAEFDKQTDEAKTPIPAIKEVENHISPYWHIQKIEWAIRSPKYASLSLLDKAVKYREKPYFAMEFHIKYKGPAYQAHDMFTALLATPELKKHHIESGGKKDGSFILKVTERKGT